MRWYRAFVEVELVADAGADRGDERLDLHVLEDLVQPRLLDVQDLAADRQDGLGRAVAGLLGRAAGGVALDDVELAHGRVVSWQSASLPGSDPDSRNDLRRVRSRAWLRGHPRLGRATRPS